jgi:hypothetical protein
VSGIGKVLPESIGGSRNGDFIRRAIKNGMCDYSNLFEGYSSKGGTSVL